MFCNLATCCGKAFNQLEQLSPMYGIPVGAKERHVSCSPKGSHDKDHTEGERGRETGKPM
jgi:hypothetical protein